ncbi:MAG TPA: glycosyltransferase [Gammaproteobacteria bacterium]
MRIAYLSYSPLHAGVANAVHVMNMCAAFRENGHDTALFARGGRARGASNDIFSSYGVSNAFELRLRPSLPVKLVGRLHYGFRQALQARLRGPADVYYARCLVSAAFALLLGGKVVLELHELPHSALERHVQRFVLRHRNLRRLVVISNALREDLARVHPGVVEGLDVVVAPDGANLCAPGEPFPLERGPGRQIGYAGGLRAGNGIGTLLALAEAFPHDTFHVLGGTADEIARWRQSRPAPNAVWYGRAAPARVPAFLAACDVLLAPYERGAKTASGNDTSRWMSPLKIFEYMAAGKAMIVSDFPVLREVLTDDVAVLVEPSNLAAWKSALARLDDEGVRRRLGDAAREMLEKRYTWTARARTVLDGLDAAPAHRSPQHERDAAARSATGSA